uniref:Uncharacterized protein MANES_16G095000 n=1 Tax=Rhizophora mucronata TaxID=61149 RepID=A0A2P2IHC4_RHIMU
MEVTLSIFQTTDSPSCLEAYIHRQEAYAPLHNSSQSASPDVGGSIAQERSLRSTTPCGLASHPSLIA